MQANNINKKTYQYKGYLNKDRWVSYFWQTKLIQKYFSMDDKILEIGVGNKIVSNFLRLNFSLTTVDINPQLNPDVIASVEDLTQLKYKKYNGILCAEVLEHLPFEKFEKSLRELKNIVKDKIIISLPYWGYTFGLKIKLPLFGVKVLKFKINGGKKHNINNSAGHYWEIGKKGYRLKKIKKIFLKNNLEIIESFWDLDDPYHYYFVLEKI